MRPYGRRGPDFVKMIAMSLFAVGCLIWLLMIVARSYPF